MTSVTSLIFYCCIASVFAADSKTETDHKDLEIDYLNVQSQIQARFATTFVTSKVNNLGKDAKEITFTAQLPEDAFISNFSMQIGDKVIYGNVKEKEEAKAEFEAAKARGESAGHVAQKPRETNAFQISVNVAAQSKVKFNLTYQEILKRVHGVYKHIINLQPDQPVRSMSVEVNIVERGEIKNLKVPKFGPKVGEKTNKELLLEEDEKTANIKLNVTKAVSNAHIIYEPKTSSKDTVAGQLVVLYDVQRANDGGDIQVVDGYFVHFFAPEGLPKGNKHVVFVLDKSGSMLGRKFQQLKEAMKVILNDLNPEDLFNIIFFSDGTEMWKPESVKANADNIKAAQLYVLDTEPNGGTNIFDSLKEGLKVLDSTKSKTLTSMLLFLTDGQPTVGMTDGNSINKNVSSLNKNGDIINSIGFGDDADILLMKKLSANNKGLAKKVYEDSDATIQLTGFYDEISTPLLSSVKINYLNETVDVKSLVQEDGENYFNGGELVTFGKLHDNVINDKDFNSDQVEAKVTGVAKSGHVELKAFSSPWICPRFGWGCCPRPIPLDAHGASRDIIIEPPVCCWGGRCPPPVPVTTQRPEPLPANTLGGFIERMWAYKTIKKLLKQNELGQGTNTTKKQALDLSLKYHFVTELTSMVVIQPNETNATALENDKDQRRKGEEKQSRPMGFGGGSLAGNSRTASFGGRRLNKAGLGSSFSGIAFPAASGAVQGPMAPLPQSQSQPHPPPPPPPPPPSALPSDLDGKKEDRDEQEQGREEAAATTEPKKPAKRDECHLNIFVVHQPDNKVSNKTSFYENFIHDLFENVKKNSNVKKSTFSIFPLKRNQSHYDTKVTNEITTTEIEQSDDLDLTGVIKSRIQKINDKNATNIVLFLVSPEPMEYAVTAVPALIKEGMRVYCVSDVKVDKSKEKELLSIAGDFANLFIRPSPKEMSDRLQCSKLYVWRSTF